MTGALEYDGVGKSVRAGRTFVRDTIARGGRSAGVIEEMAVMIAAKSLGSSGDSAPPCCLRWYYFKRDGYWLENQENDIRF